MLFIRFKRVCLEVPHSVFHPIVEAGPKLSFGLCVTTFAFTQNNATTILELVLPNPRL